MKHYIPYATTILLLLLAIGSANAAELPDLSTVPTDLTTPTMVDEAPAAGKRVKVISEKYRGTNVHHSLYLPTNWQAGKSYPVIVEYAGNGPFLSKHGDKSKGEVEDCDLGYGISGGKDFIWVCMPCVSEDGKQNQLRWWGDVGATVEYCKMVVRDVCKNHGGDPSAVFLSGFSRGSIACNYLGLHDDEIASLWCGFICHSHYDGVKRWSYPESSAQAAELRLKRLAGKPQFISQEYSTKETQEYLAKVGVTDNFTFQSLPYRNHSDAWVLRDIAERDALRGWVKKVLAQ